MIAGNWRFREYVKIVHLTPKKTAYNINYTLFWMSAILF